MDCMFSSERSIVCMASSTAGATLHQLFMYDLVKEGKTAEN